ncbi:MAG: AraC family transcriptional regulator N-terminal domain-containing protein [Pseudomonadota bacterium]
MQDGLENAAQALLAQYRDRNPGGFADTDLKAVRFFHTDAPAPRMPLSYPPGLAIILAGKKIGYLDGHRFEYGAGSYLAVGLPLVFDCETFASVKAPLFGLFLELCPSTLADLGACLRRSRTLSPDTPDTGLGVEPLAIQPAMEEAITRLVRQLCSPPAARALGAGTLREIFFHALQDAHGHVLLSLCQVGRPEARIAALLQWAETQDSFQLSTERLADQAGMSTATLHRHFRSVTGYPPVQYFRRQRLLRAQSMLQSKGVSVGQVASAIGYPDATGFSRDYRKLFGYPPSQTCVQPSS